MTFPDKPTSEAHCCSFADSPLIRDYSQWPLFSCRRLRTTAACACSWTCRGTAGSWRPRTTCRRNSARRTPRKRYGGEGTGRFKFWGVVSGFAQCLKFRSLRIVAHFVVPLHIRIFYCVGNFEDVNTGAITAWPAMEVQAVKSVAAKKYETCPL